MVLPDINGITEHEDVLTQCLNVDHPIAGVWRTCLQKHELSLASLKSFKEVAQIGGISRVAQKRSHPKNLLQRAQR